MNFIQVILLGFVSYYFLRHFGLFKGNLITRIVISSTFLAAIFFILFPESSNKVADILGVGRGADLITYLFIVIGYGGFQLLYFRQQEIRANQSSIVREIALTNVKTPDQTGHNEIYE